MNALNQANISKLGIPFTLAVTLVLSLPLFFTN